MPTAGSAEGEFSEVGQRRSRRRTPRRTCAAYPLNSCPERMGVASMVWVRPVLTM